MQKINAVFYLETSAATGDNIKKLFVDICNCEKVATNENEGDAYKVDFNDKKEEKCNC